MSIQPREWNASAPGTVDTQALATGDCQLWLAPVPGDDFSLADSINHLSAEEQLRAGRLLLASARREFIFGRATLRQILGAHLGLNPAEVPLAEGPAGKPCLAEAAATTGLRFNLTHSGGLVIIALARHREVGVDVEWRPGLREWEPLVQRIFSAREQAELHALPITQRDEAFFNGWTRKEAWLKATGKGLQDDLSAIEVVLTPGCPPEWLTLPGGVKETGRWALREISLPEGFTGALVYDLENKNS